MGRLTFAAGDRIYLDANICIYQLEGLADYADALARLAFETVDLELNLLTSELSLAEALVPAYRAGDEKRIRTYIDWFEDGSFVELIPTTRKIYKHVALLRAQQRLKTPDAIHVASALAVGCRHFVTNDLSIRVPDEIILSRIEDF